MTPNEIRERIDDLFDRASDLPGDEQDQFLIAECAGDPPQILDDVRGLLQAHARGLNLKPAPFPGLATVARKKPHDPMIGQRIKAYEIMELLGRGGFGVVYLASRMEDYQQQVAIKILRTELVAEENILARFEQERELLASLEHETICRLIDGGSTSEARPYFVMEYVKGQSITSYCNDNNVGVHDRIELFIDVCRAVSYAHQRGVVHRDLKPSNILVSDDGKAKLLDFGIAKVIDPLGRQQMMTLSQFGQPFTPEYASPEQVLGEEVGFASDVYSLGVVLYELLTGRLPYEFKMSSLREVERVVCHKQPTRPSAAVKLPADTHKVDGSAETIDPRDELRKSGPQGTDPKRLFRALRGDLDRIILTALHKKKSGRLASVDRLVEVLTNYQLHRPIGLERTSALVWCRYQARRHWQKSLATGLVCAAGLTIWHFATPASTEKNAEPSSAQPVPSEPDGWKSLLAKPLRETIWIPAKPHSYKHDLDKQTLTVRNPETSLFATGRSLTAFRFHIVASADPGSSVGVFVGLRQVKGELQCVAIRVTRPIADERPRLEIEELHLGKGRVIRRPGILRRPLPAHLTDAEIEIMVQIADEKLLSVSIGPNYNLQIDQEVDVPQDSRLGIMTSGTFAEIQELRIRP